MNISINHDLTSCGAVIVSGMAKASALAQALIKEFIAFVIHPYPGNEWRFDVNVEATQRVLKLASALGDEERARG